VYANPWVTVEAHAIVHPNGEPGEHVFVRVGVACGVVVLDGADVLLERQPRFAIDREILEIVKGGGPAREAPLDCAKRETREELGVVAERWDPLGELFEVPSIIGGAVRLFLARDCTFVTSEPEAVESIQRVRMPFAEAAEQARAGGIDDAVSAAALLRAEAFVSRER
jgi:8-oxo-dGTP pyrophosphatase MutT (NUDIX family)